MHYHFILDFGTVHDIAGRSTKVNGAWSFIQLRFHLSVNIWHTMWSGNLDPTSSITNLSVV
jgi:hypothetical protein